MITSHEEALREAEKCMYCGFCEAVCPTIIHGPHRGYGPRGRIQLIKTILTRGNTSKAIIDSIYTCTLCAACIEKCPAKINIVDLIIYARSIITQENITN